MTKLKLIYFEGCPNAEKAISLLEQTKISDYQKVVQDTLAKDDVMQGYASPTLLIDNKIIFGAIAGDGGCTLNLPSLAELVVKLDKAL